jgi:predicted carbohydrate-binding protein with CBM5 and CBM33 domain
MQTSSLQVVLESSNDQDHAHGNVECLGADASGVALGDDSNEICLDGSCASHGLAQVAIDSKVASQGTAAVRVHDSDMAMY